MQMLNRMFAAVTILSCGLVGRAADVDSATLAKQLVQASGVKGGLIVHLNCGDGVLTAALRANERYLVHGLTPDAEALSKARQSVRAAGVYGAVSIEHWTADRLPYSDNLVNLLIAPKIGSISLDEVQRVLTPEGVALFGERIEGTEPVTLGSTKWYKRVKPRPSNIDEWTHFMYDAAGNAVSKDEVVGPPRHMQWVAGPHSARGHENLASLSVAVSAHGRVFYIADEGPIASVALPSNWHLIARDAFNGVLLWKKPIPNWEWRLRPFRSGPPHIHRRLVAEGDSVYVTLGFGTEMTALDAATGEFLQSYPDTVGTEEIIHDGDMFYLVVGDTQDQDAAEAAVRRGEKQPGVRRQIMAVREDSGSVVWQTEKSAVPEIFGLTLTVSGDRVFYQTTEAVIALDRKTGKEVWRTKRPANLQRRSWASPTLVVNGDVVLSADQSPAKQADDADRNHPVDWDVTLAGGGQAGEMVAYSVKTGEVLWTSSAQQTYNAPPDMLIADGLLWSGKLIRSREDGITQGLDPLTGEVKRERPADQEFFNVGMGHHRCYRNRATAKYLVLGRSGVEFVDLKTGKAESHHWIRGTCQHGVIPANGLLYVTPHTCGCFIKAKLNGFNALAPASVSSGLDIDTPRLEKGPAFGHVAAPDGVESGDWPTHRHDIARSGMAGTTVPAELTQAWRTTLGGKLTASVIAEGKVFVAQTDAHTLFALDEKTGRTIWSFVAGGRIDSPPTIYQGMALFGSADGWVYAVRATDGKMAWRFRAAPGVRRVVSYDRLESAWPVTGSVLVVNDVLYCTAGRSSYLDGGMRLCRLNPNTGELLSETKLSGYDEKTGKQIEEAVRVQGTEMPGALPDVLSCNGDAIFLRHLKFDLNGVEQNDLTSHLFSNIGFLDDTWWHRSYWLWGSNFNAGWGGWWRMGNRVPAGRLLVFDKDLIYGFGRSFMPDGNSGQWQIGEVYRYFAAPKEFDEPKPEQPKGAAANKRRRNPGVTGKSIVPVRWSVNATLEARALVMAGDKLFAAGPVGDTTHSLKAFEGKEGIRLRSIAVADGRTLSETTIDALPVHDGLSAANERLFLSTKDGKVTCFDAAN